MVFVSMMVDSDFIHSCKICPADNCFTSLLKSWRILLLVVNTFVRIVAGFVLVRVCLLLKDILVVGVSMCCMYGLVFLKFKERCFKAEFN